MVLEFSWISAVSCFWYSELSSLFLLILQHQEGSSLNDQSNEVIFGHPAWMAAVETSSKGCIMLYWV